MGIDEHVAVSVVVNVSVKVDIHIEMQSYMHNNATGHHVIHRFCSIATSRGVTKKVPDMDVITVTVPVVAMQMHDRGIPH